MSNLIDFVPALQYLPTPLKSRAKKLHKGLVETYGGFINDLDRKIQSGEQVEESLSSHMLSVRKEEDLDHLDMSILTSAFMIGGVETVSSLIVYHEGVCTNTTRLDRGYYAMVLCSHPSLPRNSKEGTGRARPCRWTRPLPRH